MSAYKIQMPGNYPEESIQETQFPTLPDQHTVSRIVNHLTPWGRVTQICVFTLQLCKTDDANLRF